MRSGYKMTAFPFNLVHLCCDNKMFRAILQCMKLCESAAMSQCTVMCSPLYSVNTTSFQKLLVAWFQYFCSHCPRSCMCQALLILIYSSLTLFWESESKNERSPRNQHDNEAIIVKRGDHCWPLRTGFLVS